MTDTPGKPMSEINTFEREIRYIVIKRKHLEPTVESAILQHLAGFGVPTVECVVTESDWPEYEKVWRMIEDRVTGQQSENAKLADEEWLIQQLERWPERVDPERTTNITFLMKRAAAALRAEPAKPKVDREAVALAIKNVQGGINYDYMDFCRDAADAAIAAMKGQP